MPVQPTVSPHTIVLRGELHQRHDEARANAALKPGHLIKKNSSSEVLKHATAAGGGQLFVAKEDDLVGKTINDAYAAGDVVFYHIPQKGDWLYMRVAAAATAIAVNDPLTSAGDGTIKKSTGGTDVVIGHAKEALDNSGGGAEAFLRMEWGI